MRAGRLLRDKWRDAADESPRREAERVRRREAGRQANAETVARFSPLTVDNAQEAIDWQDKRIAELMAATQPEGGKP